MNYEDCEVRMKVRINDNIDKTARKYHTQPEMLKMRNKTFTIRKLISTCSAVGIKEFVWDPEDLTHLKFPDPVPIIFHFDEKNLAV